MGPSCQFLTRSRARTFSADEGSGMVCMVRRPTTYRGQSSLRCFGSGIEAVTPRTIELCEFEAVRFRGAAGAVGQRRSDTANSMNKIANPIDFDLLSNKYSRLKDCITGPAAMLTNIGLGQSIARTIRASSSRSTRSTAPSFNIRPLRRHARSYATPSTPTPSPSTSSKKIKFGPMTVILVCVPLLTGYLGVWQIQRLNWKLGLIEDVDRNLSKDPLILPDDIE